MKATAKATLLSALILFCVCIFNSANAQTRLQKLDRLEDRRDRRENVRDRKENARDRKEDVKDKEKMYVMNVKMCVMRNMMAEEEIN